MPVKTVECDACGGSGGDEGTPCDRCTGVGRITGMVCGSCEIGWHRHCATEDCVCCEGGK